MRIKLAVKIIVAICIVIAGKFIQILTPILQNELFLMQLENDEIFYSVSSIIGAILYLPWAIGIVIVCLFWKELTYISYVIKESFKHEK